MWLAFERSALPVASDVPAARPNETSCWASQSVTRCDGSRVRLWAAGGLEPLGPNK